MFYWQVASACSSCTGSAADSLPRPSVVSGWLSTRIGSQLAPICDAAFKQGMHDLGWLEGKNVEYRIVYADGDVNRLDALASELIGQKVDVIVVANAPIHARACSGRRRRYRSSWRPSTNASGQRVCRKSGQAGGNITGITSQQEEVLGKLIGILHEVAPGAQRIACLLERKQPEPSRVLGCRPERLRRVGPRCPRIVASAPAHPRRRRRRDRPTAVATRSRIEIQALPHDC